MILYFLGLMVLLSMKNPFFLTLSLLLLSAGVGVKVGIILSGWFFISIYVVFLGGMLILFFYVVSLSGSQKNYFNFNNLAGFFLFAIISNMMFYYPGNKVSMLMLEMYMTNFSSALFLLTSFLFLTLFCVVKISENYKGAITMVY